MLCSRGWEIGHLDFTQAFHSGDLISRELYAELPPEGIDGLDQRQLMKVKKTCYGLTDGPWAWYKHINRVLEEMGYKKSRADPCLYHMFDENHELSGIIALATDDMIHGGQEQHWKNMEELNRRYKMGKFTTGNGRFTGKQIEKKEDGSIVMHQAQYINDKVEIIKIDKKRKRQRYSRCSAEEISALRTSIGALAWVAKETRPDVAGRVALLQQCMPTPLVKDILEANAISEELRKDPELGIKIQPIPLENLRIGVVTDASWGNTGNYKTEENNKDWWQETNTHWVRHHVLPRKFAFHPGATEKGPDLHSISNKRITIIDKNQETIEDDWNVAEGVRLLQEEEWTGRTIFVKSEVENELNKNICERFMQLGKTSSQGGHIVIYYDKNLETEDYPKKVTIASWKSYKLKRCTVNTLSAECQSMLQGIGNVHWHRFLLAETSGTHLHLHQWEQQLAEHPYIAVTDSKSLYDTATKCRNTSSHIDDKRTAIDLTILKDDMNRSNGQVRWVAGTNMLSDSLTKKMSSTFLKKVMKNGQWSLSEKGHQMLFDIHVLVKQNVVPM